MKTNHKVLEAAAVSTVEVGHSAWVLDGVIGRIGMFFARAEPRRRVAAVLRGMLGMALPRNGWSIAEQIGERTPDGTQRLLNKAVWDQEAVLEQVRGFAVEHLAAPSAVLVIDETGDEKKGRATVGVQRQYSGTCGRIQNCQVVVFASYVSRRGHTLIDAGLYLPESWTCDPARLDGAAVPEGRRRFATKPQIAREMAGRAIEAGIGFAWVTADKVYGTDTQLRRLLREHDKGYVLAVACDHQVSTPRGRVGIDVLVASLPRRAWTRLSAGAGAKGHRLYDWTRIDLRGEPDQIMARRNRTTGEIAYYRCWSPRRTPLATLVKVAGSRWPIETDFQTSKGQCGLDEHQVRRWIAHRRWLILTMAAHAVLAVTTALARQHHADQDELIPLTIPETRRLMQTLILNPARDIDHQLHWSRWRRRRQAQAKRCHYQRQQLTL